MKMILFNFTSVSVCMKFKMKIWIRTKLMPKNTIGRKIEKNLDQPMISDVESWIFFITT